MARLVSIGDRAHGLAEAVDILRCACAEDDMAKVERLARSIKTEAQKIITAALANLRRAGKAGA